MYWKFGTFTYIIITKHKVLMWIINDVHNSLIYTIKFINIRKFIHKKMKLRKYKIYPTSKFNYPIMHHSGKFLEFPTIMLSSEYLLLFKCFFSIKSFKKVGIWYSLCCWFGEGRRPNLCSISEQQQEAVNNLKTFI